MPDDKVKTFSSLDLYLSSFLLLRGLIPKLEINDGKVIFSFFVTDDLYRFMAEYNSNISVPVADFVTYIKMLRGQMLMLRGQKGGKENGECERHKGKGKRDDK